MFFVKYDPLVHSREKGGKVQNVHRTWKQLKQLKLKLSRYTPWRHMGGEEVYLLLILNLGTRWGWVISIMPRPRFTPGERTPGTHWIGGWVGPRAGLDAEARRKILCPCRGSNPDRPARSQTLYWLSYRGSYSFELITLIILDRSCWITE
jgi:hypothetical protein